MFSSIYLYINFQLLKNTIRLLLNSGGNFRISGEQGVVPEPFRWCFMQNHSTIPSVPLHWNYSHWIFDSPVCLSDPSVCLHSSTFIHPKFAHIIFTYIHISLHIYIYVYIYIFVCVYVYVYMYIYIYISHSTSRGSVPENGSDTSSDPK